MSVRSSAVRRSSALSLVSCGVKTGLVRRLARWCGQPDAAEQ